MKSLMFCLITLCLVAVSYVEGHEDITPAKEYRCPVCGMYVSMFPDWNARIKFKDSTVAIFDGPKDLFKYYLDIRNYNPSKSKDEVTAILVKDYYSTTDIDAQQAYFVIWSDVYGPMGHEPIPLEKEADAKEFLREHNGTKILGFKDVTREVILSLDNP
ncbi:MAG: nitrous oxide reductase accessory protein NosL [Syntrophales bacterium]